MSHSEVFLRQFPGQRAALKRDILAGAVACINQVGMEASTIEMIKSQCNTSVGAIYHHFGSKEGLVADLFLCALDDQDRLLAQMLDAAVTPMDGVTAIVCSYVDWVTAEPELARFMFQARAAVANGPKAAELESRNSARNRRLASWLLAPSHRLLVDWCPRELLPSLIIGPAETYCRAWLAGRADTPPSTYRLELSQAAWRALQPQRGRRKPA